MNAVSGLSKAVGGVIKSVQTLQEEVASNKTAIENLGISITTGDITCSSITNSGALVNTGNMNLTGNLAINTNKFNVASSSGNTTVAGTLGVTGASTFGATTVSSLTNSGSLTNTGNATFSGIISVTGSVASGSLISNTTAMVKQPYMPYDEVVVQYDGNTTYSIVMQTNYLATSYSVMVTRNSTGNYTFSFTPSGYGTKTFDYAYMTGLSPIGGAALYSHSPATSLTNTVNTYNYLNSSTNVSGHYMFRLRSSNQSNTV